ncbi:protein serine/threonine phosphatase 2C [Rhizophagus clarus]|uniref:Protein serine/threonine phosphatase 2C n=1 Tax=Rhizophagus clarus TaxID=94130 RepID=A0A8H3KXA7_9GLOM|nr:protein serine/threonine phosphatase 2C [Rhizophagus clarus]
MFLLRRQALTLSFSGLRAKALSCRNLHQKTIGTAAFNRSTLMRYVMGAVGVSGVGGGILYYYLQGERQQTYNSSLNDKDDDERMSFNLIRSPREATAKLRENQVSFSLQRNNGVLKYDSNQLGSNYPIEDMSSVKIVPNSGKSIGDRLFFGIYDGHSGYNTSKLLSKKLIPKVIEHLDKAIEGCGEYSNLVSNKQELTKKAIENAFVEVDGDIVNHSTNRLLNTSQKPDEGINYINENLLSALAGSCAILAYVDTADKSLYIACTGDSRAVLGVKEENSEKGKKKWKAVTLSEDQTGRSEKEVARLNKEHPGEEGNIIINGRIFGGLEPTRSFGDSKYKWNMKKQDAIFTKFFQMRRGLPGGSRNKTPPYLIARPEVTYHKLTENDKFLVIATDGLWDELSNEEVIELVGKLLDGKRDMVDEEKNSYSEYENYNQEKVFTFIDENASTHLIRNALGGAKQGLLCNLLSLPSPISRKFRDDITVTVVFFGPDNQTNTKEL